MRAVLESICLRLSVIVGLMSGAGALGDGGDGDRDGAVAGATERAAVVKEGRAADEGSEFSTTAALLARRNGCAEVVTSGNAFAGSPFLRKILAGSLGRTVRSSGETEETSLGVALLLSSLEGQEAWPRAIGRDSTCKVSAEAAAKVAAAATAVHTPDEASCRLYRAARAVQQRAYGAIYGATDFGINGGR